jgi:Tol biopolymer transport system component
VTGSGDVQQADISPDGKYVAYVRSMAGKQSLWLKQLATDSDVQIVALDEDICAGVEFSRDGSYVYFVRQGPFKPAGDLYQVPSLGGTPRKLLTNLVSPPAFSPDGQRIAFVRHTAEEDSLLTALLDASGERVLVSYKAPEGIDAYPYSWSPDGKTLAFEHVSLQHQALTTIAAEGGAAEPVAGAHLGQIRDITWLPGSRDLVVAGFQSGSFQLFEVSLEGGEPRQITHDLSRYAGVRASADGKTLLAVQEQLLFAVQVATPSKESEAHTLSAGNQTRDGANGLAWTPDGKIVYTSVHNGVFDLWKMGADGSNPQRLTNNDASSGSFSPVVSLHGSFIAFTHRDRNHPLSIWRMEMDGTNLKQLTQGERDLSPAVSPDGRWVVFTTVQGGKSVLMKVPSGGGPTSQLTDFDSGWPAVSPDGKWIAYLYPHGQNEPRSLASTETGWRAWDLAMVPFAGGQPAKVFPLPATADPPLVWTPDGRAVSFPNLLNGVHNVWEQPAAGGPPQPVTRFTSDRIACFDWSQDGRLALSRGTHQTDVVLIKNFQ